MELNRVENESKRQQGGKWLQRQEDWVKRTLPQKMMMQLNSRLRMKDMENVISYCLRLMRVQKWQKRRKFWLSFLIRAILGSKEWHWGRKRRMRTSCGSLRWRRSMTQRDWNSLLRQGTPVAARYKLSKAKWSSTVNGWRIYQELRPASFNWTSRCCIPNARSYWLQKKKK